jgi:hypothetical protein
MACDAHTLHQIYAAPAGYCHRCRRKLAFSGYARQVRARRVGHRRMSAPRVRQRASTAPHGLTQRTGSARPAADAPQTIDAAATTTTTPRKSRPGQSASTPCWADCSAHSSPDRGARWSSGLLGAVADGGELT